jgi:outer membrane receptor protein involved in Fe transport
MHVVHPKRFTNQRSRNVKRTFINGSFAAVATAVALGFAAFSFSATTGKISGRVTDKENGNPLVGANVLLAGTSYGAVADVNGDYFIINLPPGPYSVRVSMLGYGPVVVEDVQVSTNATATINVKMNPQAIQGQAVTVRAEAISYKKDETSAVRHVSAAQINLLPVQNIQDLIEMQAGVVDGHFRGGRSNEVSYLVDGLPVTEAFSGEGRTVSIENEVIEDLEVVTGTFNAEYGRAMSGIVNAVTKDGGNLFHGQLLGHLGNYYTPHTDLFIGLKAGEVDRNRDFKFQLEGPIVRDQLTFFVNVRAQRNLNQFNAIRRFLVSDYSDYTRNTREEWIDTHNGDSSYVPIARSNSQSAFAKLTFRPFAALKVSALYSLNDDDWGDYNHLYKYAPDGKARTFRTNQMAAIELNHSLSKKAFYEFRVSALDAYTGNYLYEDPLDSRYIHDRYFNSTGPGFLTGGQDKNHTERWTKELNVKGDFTWQASAAHSFKFGFHSISHDLDNRSVSIRNKYQYDARVYENYYDPTLNTWVYPYYEPKVYTDSTIFGEVYRMKPNEFSSYLQDKMEFQEMVINLGLRYDRFDPNTVYPSNLRNPANQLSYPDKPDQMSAYPRADVKEQVSPRFGLSYLLSDAAKLHFSYGHFFQAPPMYAFYQNHAFLVAPLDYATQSGNPQLKAQKTVQYEIGLWQEIARGMGLEFNLFYRDIYDLLSMTVVSTYNQVQYGMFTNKDYGNAKGLEVKYDVQAGRFNVNVNYTLQYTRGNADNPTQTYDRAGQSRDPIPRLIPMSWDQRHTVNLTVNYSVRNAGLTLSGFFNSGRPYTWSPIEESRLARVNLYPNNAVQPTTYWADLYGYYDIQLSGTMKLRFNLLVENLLDRKNELFVNGQTGRANDVILRPTDLASHRSLFNEYIDRVTNPAAISAPRYVKLGVGIVF